MHALFLERTSLAESTQLRHALFCLQLRGIYAHGIMLTRCVNVTVANITMHNVGMFFVIDWSGHGNRVSDCLTYCIIAFLHCCCCNVLCVRLGHY